MLFRSGHQRPCSDRVENLTFPLYRPSFLFYLVCTPCTLMFHVFQRKDEWAYCGKILNPAEMHCDIFNSRFRLAILNDDVLYFYYNNREVRFSLTDCRRIYNKQKQNAWKNPVNGIDVSFLKAKDNAQKKSKSRRELSDRESRT